MGKTGVAMTVSDLNAPPHKRALSAEVLALRAVRNALANVAKPLVNLQNNVALLSALADRASSEIVEEHARRFMAAMRRLER